MAIGWAVMTPAQAQLQTLPTSRIGFPPTSLVGASGTHGPVVTGMQAVGAGGGTGVGLPRPIGFVGELHMPNGAMFTIGAKSWIVPTGLPSTRTGFGMGVGVNGEGATPKVQLSIVPMFTGFGMRIR